MLHPPAGQIGNQHRHTAAGWCPSRCPWAAAGHSRASKQRRLPHQHTRHRPLLRAPRGPRSLAAVPVGAGGRGQDLAGLQNDADHPPTHQAPPVWRATRELRDKRDLAVGLGGGARGRRGLDGMCTAMKSPTCVEGAGGSGGLGRASRSTTPSRRFTHGGNREARVARGAGPRCRWAAAELGQASRSTTPSRRLACGDLAGGRTRRHPEHPWGHKQRHAVRTARGRAAAHGHTKQPGPTGVKGAGGTGGYGRASRRGAERSEVA